MNKITEGVLYFSDDVPHITGYLKIAEHFYEVVGIRRKNDIAADLTLRQIDNDDRSGAREG